MIKGKRCCCSSTDASTHSLLQAPEINPLSAYDWTYAGAAPLSSRPDCSTRDYLTVPIVAAAVGLRFHCFVLLLLPREQKHTHQRRRREVGCVSLYLHKYRFHRCASAATTTSASFRKQAIAGSERQELRTARFSQR